MSSGPTPNFNLPILPISLCLSPGKLSEFSSCPNTSLVSPGLTPNLSLSRYTHDAHLQASCRSFHCPNTSLVSPGLTPNFSLSRYSKHFKNISFQAINWQVTSIKWPNIQHAQKWNKNTSSESRILKLFDALDFTSAMYQPVSTANPYSQGPFLAAMFLLVFWILFWEPWWSRFVGIRGAPRLTEACPRHAWQELLCKKSAAKRRQRLLKAPQQLPS